MRTPKLGLPSLIAILGLATIGLWVASHRTASAQSPVASSSPTANQAPASQSGAAPASVTSLTAEAAAASPDAVGIFLGDKGPVTIADIPAGAFRTQLEALSPEARQNALGRIAHARIPLTQFNTLRTTPNGFLYQICGTGPDDDHAHSSTPATDAISKVRSSSTTSAATVQSPALASVPISAPPVRHSKPGSSNVLYLDFNGQTITGTEWNTEYRVTTYTAVAYDLDGDRTTFNATEQAVIINVWERVAEDYQGFDIDVTTEAPTSFASNHVGRALITRSTDAKNNLVPVAENRYATGVAFIDVFGNANYASSLSPVWVLYDRAGSSDAIADTVSHEFGHNLGLTHDGQVATSQSARQEYYFGHGLGETSWAPIMGGTSVGKNVTTFSKGEYYLANNTQDDLAIIGAKLGAHADDYSGSFLTATTLNPPGTPTTGHIEASTDGDMFQVLSLNGTVAASISPYRSAFGTYGGNLDILAELYSSSGALLTTFDPDDTTTVSVNYVGTPNSSYFIRVLATGSGDPFSSDPTGYTAYGSMGAYTITNSTVSDLPPTISQQPTGAVVAVGSTATLTTVATGTHLYYQWNKDGTDISGATSATLTLSSITLTQGGTYYCTVTNSGGSVATNSVGVTVYNGTPQTFTVNPATTNTFPTIIGGPFTSVQWYYNGSALNNGDRSGRVTIIGASLRITNITSPDAGIYTLRLQAGGVTIAASTVGAITLAVRIPPTLNVSTPLVSRLGASISPSMVVTGSNLTYIYAGLPAGMTYNAATGTIIGRPTATGTFTVLVTVTDAFGLSSSTSSFTLSLVALPSTLVGNFNGIVSRQSDLNQMLGNTISFSTTSNGQIRGQVLVSGVWVPFTGFLNGSDGSDATAALTLSRNNLPDLLLTLTLPISGAPVTGTLAVAGKSTATIQAWNCPWTKAHPTTLAGSHVFSLATFAPGVGEADRPTGASFGTLAVAADGTVQWTLQPADGSALLKGTSVLGANGEIPLQAVQSNPDGSFLGWIKVWSGTTSPSSLGTVSWRHGAATASGSKLPYPLGFGLTTAVDALVETSRYTPPPKGQSLFGASTANNAAILFNGAGIENSDFGAKLVSSTAPYKFTLTNTNTAVFPKAGVANPAGFSVTIDPLTGKFTGSLTIVNTVSGRAVKRNITFSGVSGLGEQGFFLLLPLSGGTPLSGSVVILPAQFFP